MASATVPVTDVATLPPSDVVCPPVPRLSFTQGVLAGQFSFVVIAVLFLKYFVFEDASTAESGASSNRKQTATRDSSRKRTRPRKSSLSASAYSAAMSTPALLDALDYDLPSHAPESLDWLNVLMAQTLSAYRALVLEGEGGPRTLLEKALNRTEGAQEPAGMIGIDRVEVIDVVLGDKFPLLSNARVRPSGENGGVRVEVDVDFNDSVSLSVSTSMLVNFPRPRFAVLPISLGLTLERFSGTLTIELPTPAPPSPTTPPIDESRPPPMPTVHLSLHPDFALDLATTSLIGSRAKLQDVPKVEQLIGARVRGFIQDRVVWPGRVQVALPSVGAHPHHHHHHHHSRHHRASDAAEGQPRRRSSVGILDEHALADGHEEEDDDEDWEWRPSPTNSPRSKSGATGHAEHGSIPGTTHLTNGALATPSSLTTVSSASTPSIDLHAAHGPNVVLHPKLRPAPAGQGQGSAAHAIEPLTSRSRSGSSSPSAPPSSSSPLDVPPTPSSALPSPSESIPGYFARARARSNANVHVNGTKSSLNLTNEIKRQPPPLSRGGGRGRWVPRGTPTTGVSAGDHVLKVASSAAAAAAAAAAGSRTTGPGLAIDETVGSSLRSRSAVGGTAAGAGGAGGTIGVGVNGTEVGGLGRPSRTGSSSGVSWR